MKAEDARIVDIASKFEDRIHNEFGKYLNFNKIEDMTTNVFLIPQNECIGGHGDLQTNSGKCVAKTGYIYFNKQSFQQAGLQQQERMLVHEYLHRCTRKKLWYGRWVEGVAFNYHYVGLNEVLTEIYTTSIVGYFEERVAYNFMAEHVNYLISVIGEDIFCNIYFKNQYLYLNQLLGKHKKQIVGMINQIISLLNSGNVNLATVFMAELMNLLKKNYY